MYEVKVKIIAPDGKKRRNWTLRWRDPVSLRWVEKAVKSKRRVDAERIAGKIENEIRAGALRRMDRSWEEFKEEYFEDCRRRDLRESTVFSYVNTCNNLESIISVQKVSDLTQERLLHFREKLSEKFANETVRKHTRQLSAMLTYAFERGYLEYRPILRNRYSGSISTKARSEAVTQLEFERMLEAIPKAIKSPANHEKWHWFLKCLWLSGLRIGELVELAWDKTSPIFPSPELDVIVIDPKFDKKKYKSIPILPDFRAALQSVPEDRRHGPVCPIPSRRRDHASRIVAEIGRQSGVKLIGGHPTAHDIRRGFATRLAKMGMSAPVLTRIMRHSSYETTRAYYLSDDDIAFQNEVNRLFDQAVPESRDGTA